MNTILLVDDDRNIQRLFAQALNGEGFDVLCEGNGQWAVQTFKKRGADLVILDLLLPGLNGFQVAEQIRAAENGGADVPIIWVSGIYKSRRHKAEGFKLKIFEHLDKPVGLEALIDAIKRALGDRYPKKDQVAKAREEAAKTAVTTAAPSEIDGRERKEVEAVAAAVESSVPKQGMAGGMSQSLDRPFAELFASFVRGGATGALLMRRHEVKKILYLREGLPMYVKSNVIEECLGQVLVRERVISADECGESLKRMKASGRLQGEVLVEMGAISPHNLSFALELQVETKLYDLFTWDEGQYAFDETSDMPPGAAPLERSMLGLMLNGVRRHMEPGRMSAFLLERGLQYVAALPVTLPLEELGLEEEERDLLRMIDGTLRLDDLLAFSPATPAASRQLMYALGLVGLAEFLQTPATTQARYEGLAEEEKPAEDDFDVDISDFDAETEQALYQALNEKLNRLREQTYFEMLGVENTATEAEVRRGYENAVADIGATDLDHEAWNDDVVFLVEEIKRELDSALETLLDKDRRLAYLDSFEEKTDPNIVAPPVDLDAEGSFARGEMQLGHRDYKRAFEAFDEAVALKPNDSRFRAQLGWALFCYKPNDEGAVRTAEGHLKRAIALNPRSDRPYVILGRIYKSTERAKEAFAMFHKALDCNPANADARQELGAGA